MQSFSPRNAQKHIFPFPLQDYHKSLATASSSGHHKYSFAKSLTISDIFCIEIDWTNFNKKHTCYIAPQSSCCLKKLSQKNDDTQHVPCIEGEQKDIIGKLFQFFSSFLTHFYRDAFTQSCEYDTDCLIGSHDCSKE